MAQQDRVRIGFVGVGSMGQCAHLKNYAVLTECEVSAIAELRPVLRERVAARYGVSATYESHKEMLAHEELDGIVASQPFSRHGVLVPDLLEAGVPVFIEKPLASSVQVGERIVEAVRRSGTWLMVGYNKRSDPATIYAKAQVDAFKESGEIGPLRYVRVLMPAGDWVAGGFAELIRTGEKVPALETDPPAPDMDEETWNVYGAFVNYYIHQVNLLRHLLGESYQVRYADPAGVLLIAESESGVPATLEMSPYTTTVDWQESALVAFEHGYVRLDLPAPLASNRPGQVQIMQDPGGEVVPETSTPRLPWVHSMLRQAANFVGAIRGENAPPCEAEEALEDLKTARDYVRRQTGEMGERLSQ